MKDFNSDEHFMMKALELAKIAFEEKEVPIGAILVHNGTIIAKGYNQVEKLKDATAHAEMICISAASAHLDNWRLNDATLFTTIEPCVMCAGAILASRIKRVVWAAPDIRLGANGSWINIFDKKHPFHTVEITSGILQEEAGFLMKEFFKEKRKVFK
jgi:tRNA(adenine34) deaminase